jgi:hypothetical protein
MNAPQQLQTERDRIIKENTREDGQIVLTYAQYMEVMGYNTNPPKPPIYNRRMTFREWLVEDIQYWHYRHFGYPDKFKFIHVKVLETEYDLRQKAKRLKRRWADGIPEVLQVPLYTRPHKMHDNHNPKGW